MKCIFHHEVLVTINISWQQGSLDNTLYKKLQKAMAEAEKETHNRQQAERDLLEALFMVNFLVVFELLEPLQGIFFLRYFKHVNVL